MYKLLFIFSCVLTTINLVSAKQIKEYVFIESSDIDSNDITLNNTKIANNAESLTPPPPTFLKDSINQQLETKESNTTHTQSTTQQKDSNKLPSDLHFIYGFDFTFFADNLEDSFPYWDTRTLLQASIFPEIGLHFYGQNLRVGGYYIMNMGEKIPHFPQNVGLSLYYDTHYKNFSGYFGIFPRKHWIGVYPNLYYRKDFLLQNPMTNGFGLQYQNKGLKAEFIFDWYGGNLQKRIDEFLAQGFLQQNLWHDNIFLGASFLLYHTKNDELLNPLNTIKDVWLLDRLYYNAFVGFDLQKRFMPYMDSIYLSLGVLGSVERKRRHSSGLDPFSNSLGLDFMLKAQYKGFGVENSLYYGQGQMKYFSEYGESLYWGLPFYQARFYDRMEMYWEYKNAYSSTRFSFIFHFTDTKIANTQMLTIVLDTHELLKKLAKRQ